MPDRVEIRHAWRSADCVSRRLVCGELRDVIADDCEVYAGGHEDLRGEILAPTMRPQQHLARAEVVWPGRSAAQRRDSRASSLACECRQTSSTCGRLAPNQPRAAVRAVPGRAFSSLRSFEPPDHPVVTARFLGEPHSIAHAVDHLYCAVRAVVAEPEHGHTGHGDTR